MKRSVFLATAALATAALAAACGSSNNAGGGSGSSSTSGNAAEGAGARGGTLGVIKSRMYAAPLAALADRAANRLFPA